MKKIKHSAESASSEQESDLLEWEMDQLAEALCVKGKTEAPSDLDPFACYIDSLQAKFHADPRHFKSRLAKGYHALLEQLQEDETPRQKNSP